MTIYVDELVDYGVVVRGNGPEWCHMTADTEEELHAFATALGVHRTYFRPKPGHPHYVLPRGMRQKAIREGAHSLEPHEYVNIVREKHGLFARGMVSEDAEAATERDGQ